MNKNVKLLSIKESIVEVDGYKNIICQTGKKTKIYLSELEIQCDDEMLYVIIMYDLTNNEYLIEDYNHSVYEAYINDKDLAYRILCFNGMQKNDETHELEPMANWMSCKQFAKYATEIEKITLNQINKLNKEKLLSKKETQQFC